MLGAKGWVTGMANFLPKQAVELYQLTVEKKDYVAAKALFYKLLPILTLLENSGRYTQMVKAGCGMTGLTVGPPRRPLLPLPAEDAAELEKGFGLFQVRTRDERLGTGGREGECGRWLATNRR